MCRPSLGRSWPGALLLVPLLACKPSGIVKPSAPDMTALVESYDSPTGVFDLDDSAEIAAAVAVASELLAQTEIEAQLRELLGQLIEPVAPDASEQASGDNALELSVRADGYLKATRICPGWTLPVEVNPDNGTLQATATFSERGFDPVTWGSVAACRYRVGQGRVELSQADGVDAIRVYWGEAVNRENLRTRDLVFSLALNAQVDDTPLDLDVDFRLVEGGALEYLLPVASGLLVVRANADASFEVRSQNGSFSCGENFDCDVESSDGP